MQPLVVHVMYADKSISNRGNNRLALQNSFHDYLHICKKNRTFALDLGGVVWLYNPTQYYTILHNTTQC